VTVELRPMRDDEFTAWLPLMRERYAADMVEQAGMSEERAHAKAEDDIARLFPGGVRSAQHSLYLIEVDGEAAGDLWLTERDETLEPCLFVYDITVDEQHRGRGYGRTAMLFAEAEARRRGIDRVALNVFGGNEVARRLYRSLGYEENAVAMSKTV
jgi:ribosomal protein S18 acetylase RimI-like enzyme